MLLRTLKDLFLNSGTGCGMFRQIAWLKKSAVTSHCKGLAGLWLSLLNESSLTIRIPPEMLRTYVFKIHMTDPLVWSYRYFESLFLHKELKKTSYQNWFQPVLSSLAAHASTFYKHYTLFKIAFISAYIFPISMIF